MSGQKGQDATSRSSPAAVFWTASHLGLILERMAEHRTASRTEPSPDTTTPIRSRSGARGWVPLGLTDPDVRWNLLPERIQPEDWTTGNADPAVPGSVLAAEAERRPEGYNPAG